MRASRRTSARLRLRLLLAAAVLVIAGSVWLVSEAQRNAADRAYSESAAGQRMLVAMLNQETGFRGYALTRREEFLEPFRERRTGLRDRAAARRARWREDKREERDAGTTGRHRAPVARDGSRRDRRLRARSDRPFVQGSPLMRKRVFDQFRLENARLQRDLDAERTRKLDRSGLVSVAVILLVALFFFGLSYLLIDRQAEAAPATARSRARLQAQPGRSSPRPCR